MLAGFIAGPGPSYRLPGAAPGGPGKTLVSDVSGKFAWRYVRDSGLAPRVDAQEVAVADVETAEGINQDAIAANVVVIAELAQDVVKLGGKQTAQQNDINANRATAAISKSFSRNNPLPISISG